MAKPKMVMRSLRVPADLWEAAKAKADERQENISDVLREALERYVKSKR
ncbi:BrnA antitoxin family protein [Nocardioides sp. cx-169]|nr:ribbon-helix-helix protein, CopG family [Nocardioides sp. cx-169]MCD4535627.1 BrnA antitoxin family protein [Nocardioides sp. cx-169]